MGFDNFDSSDIHFLSALRDCSPNIVKFLKGLALGDREAGIDYGFLKALGCLQQDGKGDFFRVVAVKRSDGSIQSPGLRSYDGQCDLFMSGRHCNSTLINPSVTYNGHDVPKFLIGRWRRLNSAELVTPSAVLTRAWGGQSYHNYGLAVDIVLRHFGDTMIIPPRLVVTVGGVKYDTLKKVYERSGLLAWAKSCGLEWGGDWSDFPDVVHFQDTAYRPIPYRVFEGLFCLQNEKNCNFDTCRKFWAGDFDAELKAFEFQNGSKIETASQITEPEGTSDKRKKGFFLFAALLAAGAAALYLKKGAR